MAQSAARPSRRKKSAEQRRAQKRRSLGRTIQTLLGSFAEIADHRGGELSQLGMALQSALHAIVPPRPEDVPMTQLAPTYRGEDADSHFDVSAEANAQGDGLVDPEPNEIPLHGEVDLLASARIRDERLSTDDVYFNRLSLSFQGDQFQKEMIKVLEGIADVTSLLDVGSAVVSVHSSNVGSVPLPSSPTVQFYGHEAVSLDAVPSGQLVRLVNLGPLVSMAHMRCLAIM